MIITNNHKTTEIHHQTSINSLFGAMPLTSLSKTSMNYPETRWINHNSHTKHPLKEVYKNSKFECNACKSNGQGPRDRCDPCDFNIHPTCGTCPSSLFSFTHPQHMLQLITQKSIFSDHKCNLCHKKVHGLVYNCKPCNFYLHPLCTELPEFLNAHVMHPPHPIRLQSMDSKKCDVCDKSCKRWRYFCGICDVHIHVGCLSGKNKRSSDNDGGGFGDFFEELIVELAVGDL